MSIDVDDIYNASGQAGEIEAHDGAFTNDAIANLVSANPTKIRRGLSSSSLDSRLTPFLIALLAIDEVAGDIRMGLRWKAPQTIGALTDALLDPDMPLLARQRIPSILEVSTIRAPYQACFVVWQMMSLTFAIVALER